MGADIHTHYEKKLPDGSLKVIDLKLDSFSYRWYNFFGWLANVRNYSKTISIAANRGKPSDLSFKLHDYGIDFYSHSWVLLSELLEFDYDQQMINYRDNPEGDITTYREFLNYNNYFEDLETMKENGVYRIFFYFDC